MVFPVEFQFPSAKKIKKVLLSTDLLIPDWKDTIAKRLAETFGDKKPTEKETFLLIKEINVLLGTFDWEDHPSTEVCYSDEEFILFWQEFFTCLETGEDFSNAVLAQFMTKVVYKR